MQLYRSELCVCRVSVRKTFTPIDGLGAKPREDTNLMARAGDGANEDPNQNDQSIYQAPITEEGRNSGRASFCQPCIIYLTEAAITTRQPLEVVSEIEID